MKQKLLSITIIGLAIACILHLDTWGSNILQAYSVIALLASFVVGLMAIVICIAIGTDDIDQDNLDKMTDAYPLILQLSSPFNTVSRITWVVVWIAFIGYGNVITGGIGLMSSFICWFFVNMMVKAVKDDIDERASEV